MFLIRELEGYKMELTLIAGIEFIATIAVLIAVFYATLLYKKTVKASPIWFFILFALISLTMLRALVTIEWLDIHTILMEELELVFYIITVSFWLGFAYLSRRAIMLRPV